MGTHGLGSSFGVQELTTEGTIPAPCQLHLFSVSRTDQDGSTTDRSARLHLLGRITYYVSWIALFCGGLGQPLFTAMSLTKRNPCGLSVACFIICMASEVRVLASGEKELPSVVNRHAAA